MTLTGGAYLVGMLELAAIAAGAVIGAMWLRRKFLPGAAGVAGALATVVIAVGITGLVAVALGSVGLFGALPTVLVSVAIGLMAGLTMRAQPRGVRSTPGREWERATAGITPGRPSVRRIAIAVSFGIAASVLARFAIGTASAYGTGMTGFDSTWYHGTFAAMMAQSGSTFQLHEIAPQYLSWFYPNGSELLHSIGMLAFDRDLLSPGLNLAVLIGCMAACWAIGRPYGLGPVSLAAGSVVLGSGLLADQAGEARNDLLGVFFTLAAVALAINTWDPVKRRPGTGALVVIGLAGGLAAGVKLNYLATAAAVVIAIAAVAPRGDRTKAAALLVVGATAGGGYWYLRNLLQTGNPLPWITSAGPVDLPGPEQEIGGRESHAVVEYAFDLGVWTEWFGPGFREALTVLWPVVLTGTALAVVISLRRGGAERVAGIVVLATVAGWLVAPASAEGPAGEPVGFVSGLRYLAPALAVGWALLPVAVLRRRAVAAVTEPGAAREPAADPGAVTGRSRRWPVAVIAGLAAVALVAGGDRLQRSYLENRYAEPEFATEGLQAAFAWAQGRSDVSIAATVTRLYPLMGADLSNTVEFVGIDRPAGGYVRPRGCRQWREAVNRIGPDYVVTAWDRDESGQPPLPLEAGWAAADPVAAAVLRAPGAVVFELSGPLEPEGCP